MSEESITRTERTEAPEPPTKPNDGAGKAVPKEYGGPPGKEPTRYGDWEKNGRCIDF